MTKKLLCGILAALMLLSSVACTGGNSTDTDTGSDTAVTLPATDPPTEPPTDAPTEAPTESPTEPDTDPEPETEPPIEIEVPAYEDIGLAANLEGEDQRVKLVYDFTASGQSLTQLKSDKNLSFTTNGTVTKDERGITATKDVWNAVGFSAPPVGPYTAEATLYNHGDSTSVTSSVMFGVRLKTAGNLFIDSGLWVTVNNGNAYLVIHQFLSLKLEKTPALNAKEGVKVTFEDSGEEIKISLNGTHVATAKPDGAANTVTVLDAAGTELKSCKADKLAMGTSSRYVRAMQHFAPSSVAGMSIVYGEILPYTPNATVTELRDGLSYLLSEKTQYKCGYPITVKDDAALMDAEAAAALLGFTYAETDTAAVLTKGENTLTFTVGQASVDYNGTSHSFPTVVKREDTILVAADYIARWMGYTVKTEGDSVYVAGSEAILTKEKVQEMKDRYQLYQDVVYNYDDVEIEKTGVGLFEKTPYEDRVVGIAYTTWHTVSRKWGKGTGTWDIPLDGPYLSDNREVIYKHGILLRDAGVDFVFVDWTNNTNYDPVTMREHRHDFRMIEEATDVLFEVWSQIEGAPKICIFNGPGHQGQASVDSGNHQKKTDQIWRDYVEKYPDLYFRYEGKPLLMCYGATPNQYGTRPAWTDERFTVRWVTGYVGQQTTLYNTRTMASRGWWSWEERGLQTYSVLDNRVECVTCTAASRSQGKEGDKGYIPAYGRENGLTLKKQFQRANDLGAGMVILVSWNEWSTGEQPSVEVSKDLEPSEVHGTFYYDLLCEQIKKFKGQIPPAETAE